MLDKELMFAESHARAGSNMFRFFHTLKDNIKRILLDDLEFIAASLAYIIAHAIDYLFTVPGITNTVFKDGNPVIQGYINYFGVENGLLVCKLLICISVIIGMKSVDFAYRNRKTRFRAKHILYGGAILTTFGGSLWLY